MRPERFHRLRDVLARRQPDLTVLMDRLDKPRNFSAILRSCDAVGVLDAHVVLPHGRALEINNAASAGTKKWVRIHRHEGVPTAVAHLQGEGFTLVAAHPCPEAVDYRDVDYTRPTALLMGAELQGVSEAGLELADTLVRIPLDGMVRSLNVSVAAALLLFEARRHRERAGMYAGPRLAESAFRKRLFEWCYPSRARALRKVGTPYPELGPNGEILAGEAP